MPQFSFFPTFEKITKEKQRDLKKMEWLEQGQFNICFNLVGNGGRILEKVKLKKGKIHHGCNKCQPSYVGQTVGIFWFTKIGNKCKNIVNNLVDNRLCIVIVPWGQCVCRTQHPSVTIRQPASGQFKNIPEKTKAVANNLTNKSESWRRWCEAESSSGGLMTGRALCRDYL